MCGRYGYYHTGREYAELLEAIGVTHLPLDDLEMPPRFNICPTEEAPVVRLDQNAPVIEKMRWGLVPYWAPDLKGGARMINARCESVREKPAFREAFRRRRCLVPASGFYEWITLGPKDKQPMHIRRRDGRPLVFAGLWEEWGPPNAPTRTYTVVTTAANELMAPIHDRMPVILSEEAAAAWLDPTVGLDPLCGLLRPCPAGWLEAFPVSRAVSKAGYDTPECLDRPL